jgi:hypothetical protein
MAIPKLKPGRAKHYECPHCKGLLVVWLQEGPTGEIVEMPCFKCRGILKFERV